jgi:hypothetical protein
MKTLLFISFLFSSIVVFSQGDYVETLQGDKIIGEIDIYSKTSFDEVVVKNESGKQTFKSYQIASALMDEETYKPIIFRDRHQMAKAIAIGSELSLYHIRPEGEFEFATNIFIKGNGETFLIPNISFRKQTSRFLKDCIGLSTKIGEGTYTSSDLKAIVTEYNGFCIDPTSSERSSIDQMREFNQLLIEVLSYIDDGKPIPVSLEAGLMKYKENLNGLVDKLLKESRKE